MKYLGKLLLTHELLLVSPPGATERPNILFIFCDDPTDQALGCPGDSRALLETPNIDPLGPQGMKFTRCEGAEFDMRPAARDRPHRQGFALERILLPRAGSTFRRRSADFSEIDA